MPILRPDSPSSLSPSPPYRWNHTDQRGLGNAIAQAAARAAALDWKADLSTLSQGDRVADLHALILLSFWAVSNLSLDPPRVVTSNGEQFLLINFDPPFSSEERKQMALHAAFPGWFSLIRATKPELLSKQWRALRVTTTDGANGAAPAAATIEEAGIAPAVIALVGVIILASGAATAMILNWGGVADVLREKNYLTEHHQRIIESTARADTVLLEHHAAEEKAGRELPLSDTEKLRLANADADRKGATEALGLVKPPGPPGVNWTVLGLGAIAALALMTHFGPKREG